VERAPRGDEQDIETVAAKPSMHDVFGPGGFLERSMICLLYTSRCV